MEISEPNTAVLPIGAGMAGLTAAAELQRAGCRVRLVDKWRAETSAGAVYSASAVVLTRS